MVTGVSTGVTPWSGTTTVCVAAGVHVVMAARSSDTAPVNAFFHELAFFMLSDRLEKAGLRRRRRHYSAAIKAIQTLPCLSRVATGHLAEHMRKKPPDRAA